MGISRKRKTPHAGPGLPSTHSRPCPRQDGPPSSSHLCSKAPLPGRCRCPDWLDWEPGLWKVKSLLDLLSQPSPKKASASMLQRASWTVRAGRNASFPNFAWIKASLGSLSSFFPPKAEIRTLSSLPPAWSAFPLLHFPHCVTFTSLLVRLSH